MSLSSFVQSNHLSQQGERKSKTSLEIRNGDKRQSRASAVALENDFKKRKREKESEWERVGHTQTNTENHPSSCCVMEASNTHSQVILNQNHCSWTLQSVSTVCAPCTWSIQVYTNTSTPNPSCAPLLHSCEILTAPNNWLFQLQTHHCGVQCTATTVVYLCLAVEVTTSSTRSH